MMRKLITEHEDVVRAAFGIDYDEFVHFMRPLSTMKQVEWADSITHPGNKHKLLPTWSDHFKKLGETEECQQAQIEAAEWYFQQAEKTVKKYNLWSERGYALAFDIAVQNGGAALRGRVSSVLSMIKNYTRNPSDLREKESFELVKMVCLANEVAYTAAPRWVGDVRLRKQAVAWGHGTVHGMKVNLRDFDLDLVPSNISPGGSYK